MPETDASANLGRWATLKEAARILDMTPDKLLKQLKRGRRRGTQIGNNWFAYIDPDTEAAAQVHAARTTGETRVQPDLSPAIESLKSENARLREAVERLEARPATAREPEPEKPAPAPQGVQLMPLIDRIADLHKTSVAEIEFLRGELKAVREQHADEMRRKDILLQQAHKSLQEAVRTHLPRPPAAIPKQTAAELQRLRRENAETTRLLREMSSLMAVMYSRLRKA